MRVRVAIAAGLLALLGASAAAAQTAPRVRAPDSTPAFSTRTAGSPEGQWGPQGSRQSLAWEERGRWGVRLDLQQPVGRERDLNDVEAGAYLRLNRALSVGGAVRLQDLPAQTRELTPRDRNPRVRVETRLQF